MKNPTKTPVKRLKTPAETTFNAKENSRDFSNGNTLAMQLRNTTERATEVASKLFDIQIWTTDEVANYLKVSKGHIYNLVMKRKIPFRKGKGRGKLYFIPQEIYDWINEEK